MNKKTILWSIIHPKYSMTLELKGNWFVVFLFKILMKHRYVKLKEVKKGELKGYKADVVYVDEIV